MTSQNVPESATVEAERPTATILAFPVRSKPAASKPVQAQPADLLPQERLTRALASLNAALNEQRIAIANWRTVLGKLKDSTNGLDQSLQRYRSNLNTLSGSVSSLHAQSKALQKWADDVIAK